MNTSCLVGVSDSVVPDVPLCFAKGSEGRKEAGPPFEWELAVSGRSCPFPLLQRCASIFSSHRRTGTGYHVACVSKLSKSKWYPAKNSLGLSPATLASTRHASQTVELVRCSRTLDLALATRLIEKPRDRKQTEEHSRPRDERDTRDRRR